MAILDGEDPAVVHIGCGLVSDMKEGLKKVKERSGDASERSFCSQ